MLNISSALSAHKSTFWLLVALGVLLLIEILIFAILLIRAKQRKAKQLAVVGISLNTAMTRRVFQVGEKFDPTGLVATIHYNHEPFEETVTEFTIVTPELLEELRYQGLTIDDLDGCLVYAPDLSAEGMATVVVSYRGESTTYPISITRGYAPANNFVATPAPAPQPAVLPCCMAQQPAQPYVYVVKL